MSSIEAPRRTKELLLEELQDLMYGVELFGKRNKDKQEEVQNMQEALKAFAKECAELEGESLEKKIGENLKILDDIRAFVTKKGKKVDAFDPFNEGREIIEGIMEVRSLFKEILKVLAVLGVLGGGGTAIDQNFNDGVYTDPYIEKATTIKNRADTLIFGPQFKAPTESEIQANKMSDIETVQLINKPTLVIDKNGNPIEDNVLDNIFSTGFRTGMLNVEDARTHPNYEGKIFFPVSLNNVDLDGNLETVDQVFIAFDIKNFLTDREEGNKVKEKLKETLRALYENGDSSDKKQKLIESIEEFVNTGVDSLDIAGLIKTYPNGLNYDLYHQLARYNEFLEKKKQEALNAKIEALNSQVDTLTPESAITTIQAVLGFGGDQLTTRLQKIADTLTGNEYKSGGLSIGKGDVFFDNDSLSIKLKSPAKFAMEYKDWQIDITKEGVAIFDKNKIAQKLETGLESLDKKGLDALKKK